MNVFERILLLFNVILQKLIGFGPLFADSQQKVDNSYE